MKIYIVRHGQTNSNLKKVYDNVKLDEDINENGIKQAEELRDKIMNIKFDVIYSSQLKRAIHTANIINYNNNKIIIDKRLEERNTGNLAGKPLECTNREVYWDYYSNTKYGTEESINDLFNRVNSFINELKNKNYNTVLIVTHSGVSKAIYAYFNGIPKDGKLLNLGLKNGEIKEYEFK